MVQEDTLTHLLQENCGASKDIMLAYIGHSGDGSVIASYQSLDDGTARMGMHSAEVWRACRRLHATLPHKTESVQFTSTSKTERIVAQKVSGTPYYVAFVLEAKAQFNETALIFKEVMKACQTKVKSL